jgi:hypothetical protein
MSLMRLQNEKGRIKWRQAASETKSHYKVKKPLIPLHLYNIPMRFNFFSKKSQCDKCGKKFKSDAELMDHNGTAHPT